MLQRNLENLSGMTWNICGILLILSVPSCISVGPCSEPCVKFENSLCTIPGSTSDGPGIIILGRDGFMGYLKGKCNNGGADNSNILCSTRGSDQQQPLNMTVFSFEENTTYANSTSPTNSIDYGVVLSRGSPYRLSISRYVKPAFVCLIEGKCRNDTLKSWITEGCTWTKKTIQNFFNHTCNITCLDPTKKCEDAQYDSSCSSNNAGDESKINNIKINNNIATCYKCGSPFQVLNPIVLPNEISKQFNNNSKETDAGAAAETMKNLSNILSVMKNLTVASISMGKVKGVLKKITTESAKTSYFIYSSDTGIRVLEDSNVLKDYPNAFSIPEEAAKKALNQSAGSAFIGVFRFPNMTKDAENSTILNDEVYAIEMGTKISNLSNTINLTFKKNQMVGTPVCKSWNGDGTKPNWTTEGCSTLVQNDKIMCNCTHLTFFAILMIPPNVTIPQSDLDSLTYITYIGCGLSLFFLSVGLFMHFLIRKVKATDSVRVLINLFVALFLLNVAFLSNEYVASAKDIAACRVMAGFMHYCLLSSFTWFGVVAFHLCLQMAKHSVTIKHYLIKISVIGWAPPALVVSIIYAWGKYGEQTIKTDSSNVTVTMCWILDSNVHYYVNIGYYCFIFLFTFCTFIVVLRWLSMLKLSRLKEVGKVKRSGTATMDISTILGLCCMLGLTWSFAFFGYGDLRLPSYYIFTILNSSQGFFLFIYYLKASSLFGDSSASEESDMTEDTNTENPYEDLPTEDNKKAILPSPLHL